MESTIRELVWNGQVKYRLKRKEEFAQIGLFLGSNTKYGVCVRKETEKYTSPYPYLFLKIFEYWEDHPNTLLSIDDDASADLFEPLIRDIHCLDRDEEDSWPGPGLDHYSDNIYPIEILDVLSEKIRLAIDAFKRDPRGAFEQYFSHFTPITPLMQLGEYEIVWQIDHKDPYEWWSHGFGGRRVRQRPIDIKREAAERELICQNIWLLTECCEDLYQKLRLLKQQSPEADLFMILGP